MSTDHDFVAETIDWYVEASYVEASYVEASPAAATTPEPPHRVWSPRGERRGDRLRTAIASSLVFILIGAALLFGGHAAVRPWLQAAAAGPDAKGSGEVLYTMPDHVFCRHLSLDNETGILIEGALQRCPKDISGRPPFNPAAFCWGTR